jgi:hypothetical protein
MINGCVPFFLVCPFLFTLREKYRKVPLSLYEGASSEMELPVDERIPLHDNLNSPRARPENYSEMIKTSSTPDLRGALNRQRLQREDDLIMMALSNSATTSSNRTTGINQGYGTYQRKFLPSSLRPDDSIICLDSIENDGRHVDQNGTCSTEPLSNFVTNSKSLSPSFQVFNPFTCPAFLLGSRRGRYERVVTTLEAMSRHLGNCPIELCLGPDGAPLLSPSPPSADC